MKRPKLSELTLREKIGQTGFPGVRDLRLGVINNGGYAEYFTKYPFTGMYADHALTKDNVPFDSPSHMAKTLKEANDVLKIPFFVSGDMEYGAATKFNELHRVPTNMSIGAADSEELAYKRASFFARELKTMGVNWSFSPVVDMLNNFFDVMGIRCISDDPNKIARLAAAMVRGLEDEGIASSPKHFPGSGNDYRDTHFCTAENDMTKEEWDATYGKIYKSVIDAGATSIMISHMAFPAVDNSLTPNGSPRPATASKKVLDILRKELNYDGIIVTDAVAMKAISSAFDHEDVYIECFNAGNDIVLFVHDDYIDIMEKAVLDGRVSMERLDESVERILNAKEKLGLFERNDITPSLTDEENREFEKLNLDIAKSAITLINNKLGTVPFDASKINRALIVAYSPYEPFFDEAQAMKEEFLARGIECDIVKSIETKEDMCEAAQKYDLIVYAAYLAMSQPTGMPFFSNNFSTLFNAFAYGAEKSVAASFGAPSIYYNYFETAPAYLNTYSMDKSTMRAFVGGLLGDFEFVGNSPVALRPSFVKKKYI